MSDDNARILELEAEVENLRSLGKAAVLCGDNFKKERDQLRIENRINKRQREWNLTTAKQATETATDLEAENLRLRAKIAQMRQDIDPPPSINECFFTNCTTYGGFVVESIRTCREHLNDGLRKMNVSEFYHEFQ